VPALIVDPRDATVGGHTDSINQGMVDGEDPLLSLRRCRREPSSLLQQRMVNLTKIYVEARETDAEVIDQTVSGRASATRGVHGQVYAPAQPFLLARKISGSESSEGCDCLQRSSLIRWDRRESGQKDREQSGPMAAAVPAPGADR
jgi:hypothetical protein